MRWILIFIASEPNCAINWRDRRQRLSHFSPALVFSQKHTRRKLFRWHRKREAAEDSRQRAEVRTPELARTTGAPLRKPEASSV